MTDYRNYPLVTPEGQPIPIDILEPNSLVGPVSISSTPMGAALALPKETFLEIWSDVDCTLGFTVTPVNGTTELGVYHLRAHDPRLLLPTGLYLSALALIPGTLYANVLVRWGATKKAYQVDDAE